MDFSKDIEKFSEEQLDTFIVSSKLLIERKGACKYLDCTDCRGSAIHNDESNCEDNGWSDSVEDYEECAKTVDSSKNFLEALKTNKKYLNLELSTPTSKCKWSEVNLLGDPAYKIECKLQWEFKSIFGVLDNPDFKYCPYCSKPIDREIEEKTNN